MTIGLEKILTVTAEDWCKSTGKSLSDYNLVGVREWGTSSQQVSLAKEFLGKVPEGAEVVVCYRESYTEYFCSAIGTALISKRNN